MSHQLRATGEMKDLDVVIERGGQLMSLEKQDTGHEAAAVMDQVNEVWHLREQGHEEAAVMDQVSEMRQFKVQVEKWTEQVAALSQKDGASCQQQLRRKCFNCNHFGHLQHNCPFCCWEPTSCSCYLCGQPGHVTSSV